DDPEYLSLEDVLACAREVGGGRHRFRAVQLPFNLEMDEAASLPNQRGRTFLESAAEAGIAVLASAPALQGRLTPPFPPARARPPRSERGSPGSTRMRSARCSSSAPRRGSLAPWSGRDRSPTSKRTPPSPAPRRRREDPLRRRWKAVSVFTETARVALRANRRKVAPAARQRLDVVSHDVVHAARSSFIIGVSAPHPACGRLRL